MEDFELPKIFTDTASPRRVDKLMREYMQTSEIIKAFFQRAS